MLTQTRIETIGRRVAIVVVVVGLLVLAGGVLAFVRRDDIKAWVDAPAVLDAHRTMQVLDLPPGFTDDTTLTACDPFFGSVRCAWTEETASDAVEALVGALRDAGLKPGPVVCDSAALSAIWFGNAPECGAPLELSGATAWAVARERTPVGGVPLGRTAVWVMWDGTSMNSALFDRLVPELDQAVLDYLPSLTEVAAAVPARYRFAGAAACVPGDPAVPCYTTGEFDVSDLGADPVPALVAEFTDAGLFVAVANADPSASVSVSAVRFFRDDQGKRHGLLVVVRRVDGELRGEAFPWGNMIWR